MARSALHAALVALAAGALAACGGSSSTSPGGSTGPTVADVTPATGTVSTVVLVAGAGFGTSPSVTFSSGGRDFVAVVTTVTDSKLEAAVPAVDPALAASGTTFDVKVRGAAGGTTTLSRAFTMVPPAVADVNGGIVGSGTANSPFILDGASFGDPSAVGTAAGFTVEFADTTGTSLLAPVSAASWTDGFVVGTVPNGLTAGKRYQVTVTTPSGTSAPRWFQVLGSVSFSPSTIAWSAGPSLPAAVQGLAAVVVPIADPSGVTTSYVFTLGGNDSTVAAPDPAADTSAVAENLLLASVTSSGAFAWSGWQAATPLPEGRAFAAAVAAGPGNSVVTSPGEVYVLGGLDPSGAATSGVYRAPVAADGTLGAWSPATSLPAARSGHAATVFHGKLYVVGGNGVDGLPAASVWSAPIRADGTLGAWTALDDLPAPVAYHQVVTYAGYLFTLGGTPARVDPVSSTLDPTLSDTIWSAQLDIRDGSFVQAVGSTATAWVDVGALAPKAREKGTAVVAGSYLLLTGGLYSGDATGSSEESYAAFQSGPLLGTLGSFQGATGSQTIYKTAGSLFQVPYDHAAISYVDAAGNAHVIVLGGGDVNTGLPQSKVWFQY